MKGFEHGASAAEIGALGKAGLVYMKTTFVQDSLWRWLPAGLVSVLVDAAGAFNRLFWIIIMLWASDLLIGFLKAWHAENEEIEWTKVFRSIVKLLVIAVAVVAMNGIEQMLLETGIDTKARLTVTVMLVIGTADALSILSNLTHFWPGMGLVAERVKGLLGEAAKKQGEDDAQSP